MPRKAGQNHPKTPPRFMAAIVSAVAFWSLLATFSTIFQAQAAAPADADVNGDGAVNVYDLSIVLGAYGASGASQPADIDDNGQVNIYDLSILLTHYGWTGTSGPAVPPPKYFVNSTTGNDSNDGLAAGRPWRTMAKVNSMTFAPGDVVSFNGTFTDAAVANPGSGSPGKPIVLRGEGGVSSRARISGINLTGPQKYVRYENFHIQDIAGNGVYTPGSSSAATEIAYVDLRNLYMANLGNKGVSIGGDNGVSGNSSTPNVNMGSHYHDISFYDTAIDGTDNDGIVLQDGAGNNFKYVGGSIKNTGRAASTSGRHGIYASGGTGHVFDGITFLSNLTGTSDSNSISPRRAGVIIRNCNFPSTNQGIGFWSEDEAGGINPFTGTGNTGLAIQVYHNTFNSGSHYAIYQGGTNDEGTAAPGNRWEIFNNTFASGSPAIGFTGSTSISLNFDIYIKNNVFNGGSVALKTPAPGKVALLTHNGWFGVSPQGTNNLTSSPALDGAFNVTAAAYANAGAAAISPYLTLTAGTTGPFPFVGAAPDIGRSER